MAAASQSNSSSQTTSGAAESNVSSAADARSACSGVATATTSPFAAAARLSTGEDVRGGVRAHGACSSARRSREPVVGSGLEVSDSRHFPRVAFFLLRDTLTGAFPKNDSEDFLTKRVKDDEAQVTWLSKDTLDLSTKPRDSSRDQTHKHQRNYKSFVDVGICRPARSAPLRSSTHSTSGDLS